MCCVLELCMGAQNKLQHARVIPNSQVRQTSLNTLQNGMRSDQRIPN